MLERNKLTTRFVVGLPPSGPLTFDSWLFGPFCVLRLRVRLLSGRTPPDMGHTLQKLKIYLRLGIMKYWSHPPVCFCIPYMSNHSR
jgi:hypothetical protein